MTIIGIPTMRDSVSHEEFMHALDLCGAAEEIKIVWGRAQDDELAKTLLRDETCPLNVQLDVIAWTRRYFVGLLEHRFPERFVEGVKPGDFDASLEAASDDYLDILKISGQAGAMKSELMRMVGEEGHDLDDAVEIARKRAIGVRDQRLVDFFDHMLEEEPDVSGLYEADGDGKVLTVDSQLFRGPGGKGE